LHSVTTEGSDYVSVGIFASSGTEDGAKTRRNRIRQVGWYRVLSGYFCMYFTFE